ncbi:MAG TPA: nucleotidyltransferase family protein [Chloroflexota bacterium]
MEQNHLFYRRILQAVSRAGIPFLIGGAFALDFHIGANRRKTKDLDIFVRPQHAYAVLDELAAAGYETEMTDPTWLGKVFCGSEFVDVIFAFGNGIAQIDDGWFEHAVEGELWGERVLFGPLEENLWSKAFVMERDRFDGADIAHVILHAAERLDWDRLLERFGEDWRVLLSHLILTGYVYPAARARIPRQVMDELLARLETELEVPGPERLCYGAFLSRTQYVRDLQEASMVDARLLRKHNAKPLERGNIAV